jgi:thiol-disulfide isomerase/thioredoxin
MVTAELLARVFTAGKVYEQYVATAKPHERANWDGFHQRVKLTDAQRTLIGSFQRRINVLVLSGTWCGDCVQQCPIFDHIARANAATPEDPEAPGIDLRFVDRDQHRDLADRVMICGGHRVPTVIFMNEEHEFVAILGDRTLSRYRAMAAKYLGPSCPLPGAPVPADEIAASVQDWVNEFERVALLLRLSPKLRQKHGD